MACAPRAIYRALKKLGFSHMSDVSSDTESPNSSYSLMRSQARQRTTPCRDRTLIYDPGGKGLVPGVELGRHSQRRDIDETVRSLLVEPDHPVPQRLTIHATDCGRLFTRGAVERGRNR